jgi:hypothetical protein
MVQKVARVDLTIWRVADMDEAFAHGVSAEFTRLPERGGLSMARFHAALEEGVEAGCASPRVDWPAYPRCVEHKLTDLLRTLADCPKARSVRFHDRCKAAYGHRPLGQEARPSVAEEARNANLKVSPHSG